MAALYLEKAMIRSMPAFRSIRTVQSCCNRQIRCIASRDAPPPKKPSNFSWGPLFAVAGASCAAGFAYSMHQDRKKAELQRAEKEKNDAADWIAKQINDSLKSSGERKQVEKSWEKPGVFLWGSNEGGVVDSDSTSRNVKLPRRVKYFDGKVVRDLKVREDLGAAILSNGNLVQWGKGYSPDSQGPEEIVTGKDLVSLSLSGDRIITLGSDGTVYSLPMAKEAQLSGPKLTESSWLVPKSSKARLSYRVLEPKLETREKVTSISAGEEHVLLLTNRGRVFSAACSSRSYPSCGQLGVPGLTWETRPEGPFDTCHEIKSLSNIQQIAAGDYHNLALNNEGQIFAFGDNSYGQLGVERSSIKCTSEPLQMPVHSLYGNTFNAKATAVAAGGSSSFFVTEARKLAIDSKPSSEQANDVTIDLWSCGGGISGTLGNGKFSHAQGAPTKVRSLSGLVEFNDSMNKTVPIGIRSLVAGPSHVAAVLGTQVPNREEETHFGLDILLWGENSSYQLGTGKKGSLAKPTYITPPGGANAGDPLTDGNRFQITPPRTGKIDGHKMQFEQRVTCGKNITGVYCAVPK